jgi:hypothetical protein
MNKPNLFIVGAPKAGTTFLYEKLFGHPDIYFSKLKELNYFSSGDLKDSYYVDYKCTKLNDYLKHFSKIENQKYILDASVSYFISEKARSQIRQFNPDAQIVISIRNPIKRAFSHFQMDQRMGYANESLNFYLSNPQSYHYKQYVENSLYFKYISKYIDEFSRENVHIVFLEEIDSGINGLFDSLNLEKNFLQNIDYNQKINENKKPKNSLGQLFQRNRNLASKVKLLVPKKLIKKIKPLFYKEAEMQEINDNDVSKLKEFILSDIEQLENLLSKDLKKLWKIES